MPIRGHMSRPDDTLRFLLTFLEYIEHLIKPTLMVLEIGDDDNQHKPQVCRRWAPSLSKWCLEVTKHPRSKTCPLQRATSQLIYIFTLI